MTVGEAAAPFYIMPEPKREEYRVIRCENRDVHRGHDGRILAFFDADSFYIECRDRACYRWWRIRINLPGAKINLLNAALTLEKMPPGVQFKNFKKAASLLAKEGR